MIRLVKSLCFYLPCVALAVMFGWLIYVYLHPPILPDLATQARLACWYYDIHQHPDTHEQWSEKGKALLKKWVVEDCVVPDSLLPPEVSAWIKQIKEKG